MPMERQDSSGAASGSASSLSSASSGCSASRFVHPSHFPALALPTASGLPLALPTASGLPLALPAASGLPLALPSASGLPRSLPRTRTLANHFADRHTAAGSAARVGRYRFLFLRLRDPGHARVIRRSVGRIFNDAHVHLLVRGHHIFRFADALVGQFAIRDDPFNAVVRRDKGAERHQRVTVPSTSSPTA